MGQHYILERIRVEREKLKISQREMGRHLGITQPAYSKKEANADNISLSELGKIAEKLRLPVSFFLDEKSSWVDVVTYTNELTASILEENRSLWQENRRASTEHFEKWQNYQREIEERHNDYLNIKDEMHKMQMKFLNEKSDLKLLFEEEKEKLEHQIDNCKRLPKKIARELEEFSRYFTVDYISELLSSHSIPVEKLDLNLINKLVKPFKTAFKEYQERIANIPID
ncbi:helix-turn-helix domain-containing protein [Roseivirga thermotolerans]|uniref:helix-turn-helix domain-containing protein n=1 Tax=Roseivirga thermotolerans TaxID=1758176 RepID=UPI00273E60FA|nr:helix-turn-helix transcriptional regulator [Roseivirga thermotolerans]